MGFFDRTSIDSDGSAFSHLYIVLVPSKIDLLYSSLIKTF